MNKLEKWALVSQIASGIAIVVTLLILIVEIRGNTDAIHAQTSVAQRSLESERRSRLIENTGGFVDLRAKVHDGASLTPSESFRWRMFVREQVDNFEWQFLEVEAGRLPIELLNTDIWRGVFREPQMDEMFNETKAARNSDFVQFVEEKVLAHQ